MSKEKTLFGFSSFTEFSNGFVVCLFILYVILTTLISVAWLLEKARL